MSTQDFKKFLLRNSLPHLVCLTPVNENKTELLQALLLSGLACQGSSFRLKNGTRITIASLDNELPTEEFHLTYYNWTAKKGITAGQRKRIVQWEEKAQSIVNLFE